MRHAPYQLLIVLMLIAGCASTSYYYRPPAQAEYSNGHLLLEFERMLPDKPDQTRFIKDITMSVTLTEFDKIIILDHIGVGQQKLYPVPEGPYKMLLEIDLPDDPIRIEREYQAKPLRVNCVRVELRESGTPIPQKSVHIRKDNVHDEAASQVIETYRSRKKVDMTTIFPELFQESLKKPVSGKTK